MSARVYRLLSYFRARPLLTDSLLAALFAAEAVVSLFLPSPGVDPASVRDVDAWGVALAVASAAPLALRRSYPLIALSTTGWSTTLLAVLHYPGATGLAVLFALYTVGACSPTRHSVVAFVVSEFCVAVSTATSPESRDLDWRQAVGLAVVNMAVFAAAWLAGRYLKTRRAYVADEQAASKERSARERAAETRVAIAEERERIAREMHDVVAHHVTVMVVSASAARRTIERDPAAADGILASVETSGRAALTEMRRIVGYLREDEAGERRPATGLAQMDDVVTHISEAGVPVRVRTVGVPIDLPGPIDTTAYRVVQEALTNVLKHAAPASAEVTVTYRDDCVEIHVVDDGDPRPLPEPDAPGHGLTGMRERVALVGGSLRAGPLPTRGFDVHARLPFTTSDATT